MSALLSHHHSAEPLPCGSANNSHRFVFAPPAWLNDGRQHLLYFHPINIPDGNNPVLINTDANSTAPLRYKRP